MECAKAAAELARSPACARAGRPPMIFLNIGEPDFTAPPLVQDAAERALRAGRTQYTDATGLPALRERIARWYARALRPGHRAAAHRRHGRRVGRAAARLPGAGRPRRRGAAARPELPLQPPLRRRGRGRAGAAAGVAPQSASSSSAAGVEAAGRRARAACCSPRRPTRPAPRSSPTRCAASSHAVRARGGFTHRRRDLPRPELRRALRPQRAARTATTSSRSTASRSTSA